jgi:5'-methylthioadenosine phosphorylase
MLNNHDRIEIAFIGGSGLYSLSELKNVRSIQVDTPFGKPSSAISVGEIDGTRVAFLPRHGLNHHLLPSEIPYTANIYALKSLETKRIVSISAVGSLSEKIKPLDMVIPDQLIDFTKKRMNSFFGNGIVAHVSFGDPFCSDLRDQIQTICLSDKINTHVKGTCIIIEGPQFSTRAESQLYKNWGADIIGMTTLPEAKLAREAEICYAVIAMVTDYDSWNSCSEDVTVNMVLDNLNKNTDLSQKLIRKLTINLKESKICECGSALEGAIATNLEFGTKTSNKVQLLINKYTD